jgi:flagellar biosynthesis GTPase FlhF
MSNISEVKIGSIIRVKVGKNLIHAKVIQILEDGLRVCSLGKNKEFNVPQSRVQLDEQEAAGTEAQVESTVQTEEASTEQQSEQEPQAEQTEQAETTVATEQEAATVEAAEQEIATVEAEQATVEVVPEDEAAEFTPSGEDEEDEYAINPAHESDMPKKRMSLLNAAVEVLKSAGPERPMNCKEILEAILARQLWTPTDCKTPEQTLYGSIFREINTKEHPRIVKSNVKGKFVIVA